VKSSLPNLPVEAMAIKNHHAVYNNAPRNNDDNISISSRNSKSSRVSGSIARSSTGNETSSASKLQSGTKKVSAVSKFMMKKGNPNDVSIRSTNNNSSVISTADNSMNNFQSRFLDSSLDISALRNSNTVPEQTAVPASVAVAPVQNNVGSPHIVKFTEPERVFMSPKVLPKANVTAQQANSNVQPPSVNAEIVSHVPTSIFALQSCEEAFALLQKCLGYYYTMENNILAHLEDVFKFMASDAVRQETLGILFRFFKKYLWLNI
jgi:hypothetical protein